MRAFLDACTDPAVIRISHLDAPAVLGWAEWREIDAQHWLGLVSMALQEAMDAGAAAPPEVQPLAHMLLGAMVEASMLIANAPDPRPPAARSKRRCWRCWRGCGSRCAQLVDRDRDERRDRAGRGGDTAARRHEQPVHPDVLGAAVRGAGEAAEDRLSRVVEADQPRVGVEVECLSSGVRWDARGEVDAQPAPRQLAYDDVLVREHERRRDVAPQVGVEHGGDPARHPLHRALIAEGGDHREAGADQQVAAHRGSE